MRSHAIIKKVDQLGRIVLPSSVRKKHGIETDTPLEVLTDDSNGTIVLRVFKSGCAECGTESNYLYGKLGICEACVTTMQKEMKEGDFV
jgi:transcriptional pleiotropic regulator of transition state genes